MAYIDIVKPWYETGDFPTQTQFWDWMAKQRWKDEFLEISDINGLTAILNALSTPIQGFVTTGADFHYTIPAGFLLEDIILVPFTGCKPFATIDKVGGGVEDMIVYDDEKIVTDLEGDVWVVKKLAVAAREIIIYNLPAGSKVFIVRKKII